MRECPTSIDALVCSRRNDPFEHLAWRDDMYCAGGRFAEFLYQLPVPSDEVRRLRALGSSHNRHILEVDSTHLVFRARNDNHCSAPEKGLPQCYRGRQLACEIAFDFAEIAFSGKQDAHLTSREPVNENDRWRIRRADQC